MKKKYVSTLLLVIALALTLYVTANAAESVTGWIQGFNCVLHGHRCPIDTLDPHLMLEPDFVLLLDNGDYYLLPNIARIVKAKYVHKSVKVTGNVISKYKSIDVDEFEVKDGGSYKTVWSKAMMMKEWENRQKEFYGVEH
jgi:hypothetical protein